MTETFKFENCTVYVTHPDLTPEERQVAESRIKNALLEFGRVMEEKIKIVD